jgi:hypothetical protein
MPGERRWHECLSSEAVGFRELGTVLGVDRLQAGFCFEALTS